MSPTKNPYQYNYSKDAPILLNKEGNLKACPGCQEVIEYEEKESKAGNTYFNWYCSDCKFGFSAMLDASKKWAFEKNLRESLGKYIDSTKKKDIDVAYNELLKACKGVTNKSTSKRKRQDEEAEEGEEEEEEAEPQNKKKKAKTEEERIEELGPIIQNLGRLIDQYHKENLKELKTINSTVSKFGVEMVNAQVSLCSQLSSTSGSNPSTSSTEDLSVVAPPTTPEFDEQPHGILSIPKDFIKKKNSKVKQ
jgi:hypothetical protein